ncbi:MAG: hypothetical protein M0Q43_05940 [Methanothrix sp.]|nr:hypothetical protein [Methanothrix sp.]
MGGGEPVRGRVGQRLSRPGGIILSRAPFLPDRSLYLRGEDRKPACGPVV